MIITSFVVFLFKKVPAPLFLFKNFSLNSMIDVDTSSVVKLNQEKKLFPTSISRMVAFSFLLDLNDQIDFSYIPLIELIRLNTVAREPVGIAFSEHTGSDSVMGDFLIKSFHENSNLGLKKTEYTLDLEKVKTRGVNFYDF